MRRTLKVYCKCKRSIVTCEGYVVTCKWMKNYVVVELNVFLVLVKALEDEKNYVVLVLFMKVQYACSIVDLLR